ncbi:isochorismatase family protein [Guyparkeria halophila]|uniref:isochorismatase n=1 Tax=Guyparkeria halophila TaxID=47960 RepID=A0ABZ0YWW8_9GAMM|nr:isochorismatase family protein [Guyparkeria halophila]WQH16675.1 isochorismatase family protein [Guyparkeria halophila]
MSIGNLTSYPLPSASELPESRVAWPFQPERAVLLIHDMQEYFVAFYGTDSPLIEQVVRKLVELKARCKALGIPVVYTAQPTEQSDEDRALLNDMWGRGLPARPERYPVVGPLSPEIDDTVLTKWRYSAFHRSPLADLMRDWGRDQLLIGGIYGHIGVMQTAVDAFMRDVKPFVVADATADFSREDHLTALRIVARTAGRVLTLEDVVAAAADPGWTRAGLRGRVRGMLLDADELRDDDNLVDFGLDSVAMLGLAEELQRDGIRVDFATLAANPSIDEWWRLIDAASTPATSEIHE